MGINAEKVHHCNPWSRFRLFLGILIQIFSVFKAKHPFPKGSPGCNRAVYFHQNACQIFMPASFLLLEIQDVQGLRILRVFVVVVRSDEYNGFFR